MGEKPRRSYIPPERADRKHLPLYKPGVFVPKPREKSRPLDERIARLRSRGDWSSLDAEPRPDEHAIELKRRIGKQNEDIERRKKIHLDFLASGPSPFQVRFYIERAPFKLVGVWHPEDFEDEGIIVHGGWIFDIYSGGGYLGYDTAREAVKCQILEVFEETLGDLCCEHGKLWKEDCQSCEIVEKLERLGRNPDLLNFPDARNVRFGNTRSANTILSLLGLSKWAGVLPQIVYAGNINDVTCIDDSQISDTGKAMPPGHGPDSAD